jgi:hypothetical protein
MPKDQVRGPTHQLIGNRETYVTLPASTARSVALVEWAQGAGTFWSRASRGIRRGVSYDLFLVRTDTDGAAEAAEA